MDRINTAIFINIIKYLDLSDIQALSRSDKFMYRQFKRTQIYKDLNALVVVQPDFQNKFYNVLRYSGILLDIVFIGISLKCWYYFETSNYAIMFLFGWIELRTHIKLNFKYDYGAILLLSFCFPTVMTKLKFLLSYVILKYMAYTLNKVPRLLRYVVMSLLIYYPSNFSWLLAGLSNYLYESIIDRYYPNLSNGYCMKRIINSVVKKDPLSQMLIQKYKPLLNNNELSLINIYAIDCDNPIGLRQETIIHLQIPNLVFCDAVNCYTYLLQQNIYPDLYDHLGLYLNVLPTIWLDPKKICPKVYQLHQSLRIKL